jgi:MFS-type transporter involved in bile tolerance (Atg22 family)
LKSGGIEGPSSGWLFRGAYAPIILLGLVSLMGDLVYEGGRGVIPDYLNYLGASALIVGLVTGFGEFLGYVMRLVSGFLADTTRAYWLFVAIGYGLIIAIPLLAFTSSWQLAAVLVVLERLGKALRTPSRDVILSVVSRGLGVGKAFGVHELLDQAGAALGPLTVAFAMLYTGNSYSSVFTLLFIPFAGLLLVLGYTYRLVGSEVHLRGGTRGMGGDALGSPFYIYVSAVAFNTVGLMPASLILFRASELLQPVHQQWLVPALFFVIQGVDAPMALLSGLGYDRAGVRVLLAPFALSVLPPILLLWEGGLLGVWAAAGVYGAVLGMQESIYRAAVADLAPPASRGRAYGIFNTAYGLAYLASGAIFGAFMDSRVSILVAAAYAAAAQSIALLLLLAVGRHLYRM